MGKINWRRRWEMRDKSMQAALANPGEPVPGTGRMRRRHRCDCLICKPRSAYQRPRKGGGKKPLTH